MSIEHGYSPAEDENLRSRLLSDAELLNEGAQIEEGVLQPSDEQIKSIEEDKSNQEKRQIIEANPFYHELKDYMEKLNTIDRGLRRVVGIDAGNMAELGDIRNECIKMLKEIGIEDTPDKELQAKISKNVDTLFNLVKHLDISPRNIDRQDVDVTRSNGQVEGGWIVKDIQGFNTVRVENESQGLFKNIPLGDLYKLNYL